MPAEDITQKLEKLSSEGTDLYDTALNAGSMFDDDKRESAFSELRMTYSTWYHTVLELLTKLDMADKARQDFEEWGRETRTLLHDDDQYSTGERIQKNIESQMAALRAVIRVYKEIEPLNIENAVAQGVYENELAEAEDLLNGDHVKASAAITRSVLEDTLSRLCRTENLEPEGDGINNKAKILWKDGPLSKVEFREIQKWADVGNNALHDDEEDVTHAQVAETIENVRDFIDRLDEQ